MNNKQWVTTSTFREDDWIYKLWMSKESNKPFNFFIPIWDNIKQYKDE